MDFLELLNNAISNGSKAWIFEFEGRQLKVFPTTIDFGDDEPEEYITFDYYSIPFCFSDNEERAIEHSLTLHIVTKEEERNLYRAIKKQLKSHDFVFQQENGSLSASYPQKNHEILEFKLSTEETEE